MKNLIFLLVSLLFFSCGEQTHEKKTTGDIGDIAFTPRRDREIQRYNLKVRKDRAAQRTPYDTISLMEHVINNYPDGTYLVLSDEPDGSGLPEAAVIYYQNYVFAVIAKSRPGERLIETKNIIGFDESLIDYDSTKLGTAFFDLVLYELKNNTFQTVWEAPIPSHGGFNYIRMSRWGSRAIPKITVNFYYAFKRGAIDYNYYLINGITQPPHLMMTYSGINFRRTEADINKDEYPDYYEHVFYDLEKRIIHKDSVGFVWRPADTLYISLVNRKQTRPY